MKNIFFIIIITLLMKKIKICHNWPKKKKIVLFLKDDFFFVFFDIFVLKLGNFVYVFLQLKNMFYILEKDTYFVMTFLVIYKY